MTQLGVPPIVHATRGEGHAAGEGGMMAKAWRILATLIATVAFTSPAVAQKSGGILRIHLLDSPASMSIHEESTVVAERPVMAVFNNLVYFDQHIAQNSMASIRPELATSWSWNEAGTELTFKL